MSSTVDVLFPLTAIDGWPPYPAEEVPAELVGPDRARLTGIPMYVDGVSRGDVVAVEHDGAGLRAGPVVERGRHTTIRVVTADAAGLAPVRAALERLGTPVVGSESPALLAADVDDRTSLEDVLVTLDSLRSLTCTYTVTCLQHRVTACQEVDLSTGAEVLPAGDIGTLDTRLRGRVIRPGDPDWDSARQAWNLAVDQRPAFVVEVADAFDVQAVVRLAAAEGLRVAPQATGHNAAPLGDLSDAILLKTHQLGEISVDPDARTVRVGSGVLWSDVIAALAPYGLAALAGSSPDVGVAGYALGGGYSWLGRQHGLASSSIRAVELVTADGTFHRVDAESEPELFWAVRGGGANVGVVCALELDVLPIAEVYAGSMLFPLDRAAEIFPVYERWTRDLDDAATTCIRLLRLPPMPELPEPLRGNAFVMIDGAVDADEEAAVELLRPLRDLGPMMDSFAVMPTAALSAIHMDPPQPVPAAGDGLSLGDLTPETIDTLLRLAGPGVESSLLAVDLRHLGGALGRPDPRGGIVDHLPGRFLLFAVGIAPTPEVGAAVQAEVAALVDALQPWAAEQDYLNFRETAVLPERLYSPESLQRLRAAGRREGATCTLVANHSV